MNRTQRREGAEENDDMSKPNTIKIDVEYIRADAPSQVEGDWVIVRSAPAGVHVGQLVSHEDDRVVLHNTSRVWRWRGARTLSEMSLSGVDSAADSDYTRVSVAVAKNTISPCCEVIPCAADVARKIATAGWAE